MTQELEMFHGVDVNVVYIEDETEEYEVAETIHFRSQEELGEEGPVTEDHADKRKITERMKSTWSQFRARKKGADGSAASSGKNFTGLSEGSQTSRLDRSTDQVRVQRGSSTTAVTRSGSSKSCKIGTSSYCHEIEAFLSGSEGTLYRIKNRSSRSASSELSGRNYSSLPPLDSLAIRQTPIEDNWALNMVAVYHNAFKYELLCFMEMMEVLSAWAFIPVVVDNCRNWWKTMSNHLRAALKFISNEVFGALEEVTILQAPLDRPGRHSLQMAVFNTIEEIQKHMDSLVQSETHAIEIRALFDVLCGKLLSYFNVFESQVPPLIAIHFADEATLSSALFDEAFHCTQAPFLIPMVLRTMPPAATYTVAWTQKNFTGPRRVTVARRTKQYERQHVKLVEDILKFKVKEPQEMKDPGE